MIRIFITTQIYVGIKLTLTVSSVDQTYQ
uniref:Uncharacterized protein n=1 Tax=Amphimedon queenslandica TaxID=400682 RepID=A0A1X7U7F3_AMPQE